MTCILRIAVIVPMLKKKTRFCFEHNFELKFCRMAREILELIQVLREMRWKTEVSRVWSDKTNLYYAILMVDRLNFFPVVKVNIHNY